ncbi:redoxin domain-containing protein [Kangiella sp. TOML190]|uniref:redoxin domain-containing protein n=1 Tax=Kangiella sp. TOML190 TaxID=2931351 RepID=UPI00203FBE2D|nr:redoxin domain-containing protein [Kangiella sp. TOML190]
MQAPEFWVESWLNSSKPLTIKAMAGKVMVIYAFQMLCPACVQYSLPQAKRLQDKFAQSDTVQIMGLHSVFEHHAAQNPATLQAFAYENKLSFPIAIDTHQNSNGELDKIPQTMQRYRLQGTPSLLVIDAQSQLQIHHFGHLDDLTLGLELMSIIKGSGDS